MKKKELCNGLLDICFNGEQMFLEKENNITLEKKNNITSEIIIKQLGELRYVNNKTKEDKVEDFKFKIPFNCLFYAYLFVNSKIPTLEMVFNEYIKRSFTQSIENDDLLIYNFNKKLIFSKNGLNGRIGRAYPSFIRDFYLFTLFNERNLEVSFSANKDYYGGVDITINYKGKEFSISIFTHTERGIKYKISKGKRHDYESMEEIEIRVHLDECIDMSGFKIFNKNIVDVIINRMELIINETNV